MDEKSIVNLRCHLFVRMKTNEIAYEDAFLDEKLLVALCHTIGMKRIKCERMSLFMSEH